MVKERSQKISEAKAKSGFTARHFSRATLNVVRTPSGSDRSGVRQRMAAAQYPRARRRRRIGGHDQDRLSFAARALVQFRGDLPEPEDDQPTSRGRAGGPRGSGSRQLTSVEGPHHLLVEGEQIAHQRTSKSEGKSSPALPIRHSSKEWAFSGRSRPT